MVSMPMSVRTDAVVLDHEMEVRLRSDGAQDLWRPSSNEDVRPQLHGLVLPMEEWKQLQEEPV